MTETFTFEMAVPDAASHDLNTVRSEVTFSIVHPSMSLPDIRMIGRDGYVECDGISYSAFIESLKASSSTRVVRSIMGDIEYISEGMISVSCVVVFVKDIPPAFVNGKSGQLKFIFNSEDRRERG